MTARHFPSRTWWHYEFRFFSHFYAGKIMSPTWPYQQQDCENALKMFDFMFFVVIILFCDAKFLLISRNFVTPAQKKLLKNNTVVLKARFSCYDFCLV